MLSFDDSELSKYRLTADRTFSSFSQALDYLLKGLPLRYEVTGGIYIIYKNEVKEKPKKFLIAGRVFDKTNLETLPFSSIQINNSGLISDARGYFSMTSSTDSIFNIKISYLGYYVLDTTINPGTNYFFKLIPSVVALEEIIVEGSAIARTINTGTLPGTSRLNHKVAYFLPGNGDNSIFNLMRLQTGVLAAGEQSSDLIIWGSYEGQSQVIFDGFTLYGMKNFNDNISAVNPYMAKDIKVLKGGYGAEYGERVGGIVDITGTDGNRLSPSAQFCINNMTVSGLASVPFKKKSSLMLAYRQTYYSLYDPITFSSSGSGSGLGRGGQSSAADYYVTPEYQFRDINLKYSGSGKKGNYYVSLYGGNDNFSYAFNEESLHRTIALDHDEGNIQFGGAAFYGFIWKEKNTTNFSLSYSTLHTDRIHLWESVTDRGMQQDSGTYEKYNAEINEINGRIDNNLNISDHHHANTGLGMLYYYTSLESTYTDLELGNSEPMQVPYVYLQDNITLSKKLTLKPGLRIDYLTNSQKIFMQPRLSALFKLNENFKVNSAAGIYNQFTAKNMILDQLGNYRFAWELCDDERIPVLKSNHYTAGISFNKKSFTASVEGYFKYTRGIIRYLQTSENLFKYEGDARTKGLDVFVKKDFKNQTFWISYTLSKTEEHFPYFASDEYKPAIQDERQEIKFAGLVKIKSFHISANYVYGSGLPDPNLLPDTVNYAKPYSRLDASAIYKFSIKKLHLDAGLSVLNIMNTENIKYANFTRIPAEENTTVSVYAEAVPRIFTLFLNVYF